jgi:hypothetical protein
MKKSCDCLWGFKGADCGVPCISALRTDVCSLNPNRIRPGCAISTSVPCNGKGTFDSQDFRYQPARDDIYDCESDGSCVCRRGYQGQACEIGKCIFLCLNTTLPSQTHQSVSRLKQTSLHLPSATCSTATASLDTRVFSAIQVIDRRSTVYSTDWHLTLAQRVGGILVLFY